MGKAEWGSRGNKAFRQEVPPPPENLESNCQSCSGTNAGEMFPVRMNVCVPCLENSQWRVYNSVYGQFNIVNCLVFRLIVFRPIVFRLIMLRTSHQSKVPSVSTAPQFWSARISFPYFWQKLYFNKCFTKKKNFRLHCILICIITIVALWLNLGILFKPDQSNHCASKYYIHMKGCKSCT